MSATNVFVLGNSKGKSSLCHRIIGSSTNNVRPTKGLRILSYYAQTKLPNENKIKQLHFNLWDFSTDASLPSPNNGSLRILSKKADIVIVVYRGEDSELTELMSAYLKLFSSLNRSCLLIANISGKQKIDFIDGTIETFSIDLNSDDSSGIQSLCHRLNQLSTNAHT